MTTKIENDAIAGIEVILYKYTETLACGFMGIKCEENQVKGDSYLRIANEIYAEQTTRIEALIEEALKVTHKYWSQYCNIRDTKSCVGILQDIYEGIEALKATHLKGEEG